MLIILDLGANDGCSIKKFVAILSKLNICNYKIYSYEPIQFFNKYLSVLKSDNIKIINKVVSTNNNPIKLYLSTHTNDGSSTLSSK